MKIEIDTDAKTLSVYDGSVRSTLDLYSSDAFEVLTRHWLRVGWSQKFSYRFTWLGRPVIQLPEDLLRIQELIYALEPDVIVETGVAHGGSLVFYASLCRAIGKGHVIGVDIDIRPHNRAAIDAHPLRESITLIEASSTDAAALQRIQRKIGAQATVLVILDSNHSRAHVGAELEAYAPLVTPGSYLVVQDGVMRDLHDVPGGRPEWAEDNPASAVGEFLARHPEFVAQEPSPLFDESCLGHTMPSYWPGGWLKKSTHRP